MKPDEALAAATLAIFAVLSLPTLYVLFRHGFKQLAFLGWTYLFLFCTLKLIGSGLAFGGSANSNASIISSVGLSPLLLATAGVLHEARTHRAGPKPKTSEQKKLEYIGVLAIHIIVMSGIAIVATAASSLAHAGNKPDDVARYATMAKAGATVLFVAWVIVDVVAVATALQHHFSTHDDGDRLLLGVLLSIPFLGVRVVGSLVYFATGNASLNGGTGSIGARVGMYLLMEIIVTLVLIGAGLWTAGIRKREGLEHHGAIEEAGSRKQRR